MIASVLKLSRADCENLRLKDTYGVHKVIYSLFPKQDGESRDFLFVDKGGDWDCRQILILSQRKPEATKFGKIISKEIPESFLNCDCYRFEVTLNPTQRNGPSQKTTPIKGMYDLRAWFINKAPALGFAVESESLQVCRIGVQKFDKVKDGKTFTQTHGTATFIGKLSVTDRQLFIQSFKRGIGRAKGFGFGLLQLVPIKNQ